MRRGRARQRRGAETGGGGEGAQADDGGAAAGQRDHGQVGRDPDERELVEVRSP